MLLSGATNATIADNPASIHIAGAWSEVVNILALAPFAFYRQSLISMRILLEDVLAFSYYQSHPVEFATSCTDPDYWISKKKMLEFHQRHTWKGKIDVERLGIVADFNRLYSTLSQVIHAQSTANVSIAQSFESFSYDTNQVDRVCSIAENTDDAVSVFLSSVFWGLFPEFPPESQKIIIGGWPSTKVRGLQLRP